jgi:serine/threonine protein kinase
MDTTPDSQALPPGTHLHEFVIEGLLGSGGFGITYLARDTSLGRQVVIKENLPAQFAWRETTTGTVRPRHSSASDAQDYEWSMQNFLREAETLASLDHPGIVRVLRKFETNGTAYFVMPFVDGVTFDSLIEERSSKNKPLSQDELLGLTTRMLAALGYLHQRNLYHRDIKPGNILITNEGLPVLIDFGSARQSIGERSLTVIESPGYTPFEQLQSHGNIGPWSDLYALGATLAKAITFKTLPKAADRMMDDPWPGLTAGLWTATYSDWFLQAIDRSMAVEPRNRWQSATDWLAFLNSGGTLTDASACSFTPPPLPDASIGIRNNKEESCDHGGPLIITRFWTSKTIKTTIVAAGITFIGTLIQPKTVYEQMMGSDRGFAVILGETLGGLIGAGMIALVISLVFSWIMIALKKPFVKSLSSGYSVSIIIVTLLMLFGNFSRRNYNQKYQEYSAKAEAENAKKTISGLEDDIHKMIAEGNDADGLPKNTDFRFEKKNDATDDMGRIRELMQSFFNDILTLQNDYNAALDKDGLNTLLDANRVASDSNFRESKAIITRLQKTVLTFRAKASGIVADFPKRLNDYSFSEKSNVDMMSGYKKGVGKTLPLLKETWDLEVKIIDHMNELLAHLEEIRSYWKPENGIFAFERDDDLEKFNAIMAKISACVERQAQIKQSTQKSAAENIGNLKAKIPE